MIRSLVWTCIVLTGIFTSPQQLAAQLASKLQFPEIRITLSEKQFQKLQSVKGYKMKLHDAKMVVDGHSCLIRDLHLRGNTTLNYRRKSFAIDLESGIPINIEGKEVLLKKFHLLNLAMDRNLWHNRWSYLTMAQLNIFPPRNTYCTVWINDVPQGIYLLVEKPQHALATINSPYMIRRGAEHAIDNEYIETEKKEEVKNYRKQYRSLYEAGSLRGSALYAYLNQALNMEGYFTWLGFNYFIKNGDYADELFLYLNPDTNIYEVMGWDYDDLFTDHPHEGKAVRNQEFREHMIFSMEDDLDKTIAKDDFIYSKYLGSLKKVLQTTDSTTLAVNGQKVLQELAQLGSDPEICQASRYLDKDPFDIEKAKYDIERAMKYLHYRRIVILKELGVSYPE